MRNATRIDPLQDDQKAVEIKQQYRGALDRVQQERSDVLGYIEKNGTAPRKNEDGSVTTFHVRDNGQVVAHTRKNGHTEKIARFQIGEPDRGSVRERGHRTVRQQGDNVSVSGQGRFSLDQQGRVRRTRSQQTTVNGISSTKTTVDTVGFDGKTKSKTS
ncbi:MAG: hypothetical protein FJX76_11810 [Armatimonadetes bacterium]|nr:hypothetical protein [Armatimonadota bacterium]